MILRWWPEPTAGDIVWCHFPDNIDPRPKPRPALVLTVYDDEAPQFIVQVAYGTSQKTDRLFPGEFLIAQSKNPAAYAAAHLSFDTKFNVKQALDLPYSSQWFSVPPAAPHGQRPVLGTLHPSMVRAAQAAYQAASL
jgi:hypothetical protein